MEDVRAQFGKGRSGVDLARRVRDQVFDSEETAQSLLPTDLSERYRVYSYRSAGTILRERAPLEWSGIKSVLADFWISRTEIRSPGGNESSLTRRFGAIAVSQGFHKEVSIEADLLVKLREGKGANPREIDRTIREDYIHNHKIDFWRGRVAFDFEWNSKDQTYDRDLSAFRSFFEAGVIDVGVIVTRELSGEFFRSLGMALTKDGTEAETTVAAKFGASTTGTHKLIGRIAAGRSGGCPVLAIGILPANITEE